MGAIGHIKRMLGLRGAKASAAGLPNGLGRIVRPAAGYRWLLPQLAAITPQYIEQTLRGALEGNHVAQWELFDLMEDTWPHLNKSANELKNAAAQELLGWKCRAFQEEGEPVSDSAKERARLVHAALRQMQPEAAADENDFAGTIYDLCDAWLKGTVVLGTEWHMRSAGKAGEIMAPRATVWVHPRCYAWGEDGRLGLITEGSDRLSVNSDRVQPFDADSFLVGIVKGKSGAAVAGARLRALAWWWCAANFSADWLLNLAQIFGLPFRWGNYDANAPQATVDAICAMLENMGSAGWAAFPAGTTLELKDAGKTGDQSPQGDLLDRADRYCDILVLGQTLTTEVGDAGSQALGNVHSGVKHEVVVAVCGFVSGILNGQLIPSVMRLNYGDLAEMPQYSSEKEEEGTLEFKREVLKMWSQHAVVSAVLANLTDLKQLVRDVGMPVNEAYIDPYVPVRDQTGALVTGETLKDSEGDVIGALPAANDEGRMQNDETRKGNGQKPKGEEQDTTSNIQHPTSNIQRGEEEKAGLEAENSRAPIADGQEQLEAAGNRLVVGALMGEMDGINARLAEISQIEDGTRQRARLVEVLVDLDKFERDLARDPAIAQAIYKILAAGLGNGMAEGINTKGTKKTTTDGHR